LYGFAKSLVVYPGLGDREPHDLLASSGLGGRLAFAAWYGTVTVAAVLPLLLIARQWPALQRDRRLLIVLLAWIALELPFLIYWEPSYVKYFGPVLIPWWASAAILLAHAFGAQPAVRRAFVAAALVFIAGVGTTNLVAGFAPAAYGGTDWRRIGALLASRSSRQDLFISAEYRPLDFYLPYFDQRRVVSAEFVSTAARNDPAQVEHTLRRLMRETAERGGRVFAYPCGDPPRLRIAALVDPSTERLESLPLDGSTPSGFAVCEIRATR